MLHNFIYVQTKELFLEKFDEGEVLNDAIVFIEDTKEIWTHGEYFCTPMSNSEIQNIAQSVVNNYI